MARTKPFFYHIQHATGSMARSPESGRYDYHDQMECAVGQRVKKSGHWQYYLGRPGEERNRCPECAQLGDLPAEAPTSLTAAA